MEKLNRRQFVGGLAGTVAFGCLRTAYAATPQDWKTAFGSIGFDPTAADCGIFVLSGDVHVPNYSHRLAATIDAWNAMTPTPAFAMMLGDNVSYVSQEFGHKPRNDKEWKMAADAIETFNAETSRLRKDIPLKLVIGNHDSYPGEKDAEFFCSHVRGGMKPYYSFDALGIRFIVWNGGNDGSIDPAQRAWIRRVVSETPKGMQICVCVHQPSVGAVGMERGVSETAQTAFADRTGENWLLAGHIHYNRFRKFKFPASTLVEAAHPMNKDGYWIYGVRNGRIAARVFCATDAAPVAGDMPDDIAAEGRIPVAFDAFDDIRTKVFVGEANELAWRKDIGRTADSGSWFIYLDRIRHVFPLAQIAPGAQEILLLGWLDGNLKTHEPEHFFLSADGEGWTEVKPVSAPRDGVVRFPIPKALRNAATLHTDFRSYHYDARSNLCGFAFR